jgi:plasmid stabilization system protein ParE
MMSLVGKTFKNGINYNQFSYVKVRFERTISEGLKKIALHPKAQSIRFEDVRIMPLKKFPFLIFYRVDDTKQIVTVIAIWHQSRDRDPILSR